MPRYENPRYENGTEVQTVGELLKKAYAFDAIVKECKDNPTKSRKWVLSLMERALEKVLKKTK